MSITIYWDSEQKDIIRVDVAGAWTWEDYHGANLQMQPMFLEVSHRVDIIADLREADSISNDVYGAQYVKRGRETRPDNYGVTVNLGASTVEKAIFLSGTKISEKRSKRVFFTDSLEDAYKIIIHERQDTL